MKTCSNCGDEFDGDVCPMCNTPAEAVTDQISPTEKQAVVNGVVTMAEINPLVERLPKKVGDFVKKTKTFDSNKHGLIGTIVTVIFAVVFILLALCVPIKVSGIGLGAIYDSEESESEKVQEVMVRYVDVDQSILRFYECALNFGYSVANQENAETSERLKKEYIEANESTEKELEQWLLNRGKDATTTEISEKKKQILANKLSETNYSMIMIAIYNPIFKDGKLLSGDIEIRDTTSKAIIGGLGIAITLSALSIIALVYAIMSLVALLRKKNKNYLFKMLFATCICSIVAVCISMICPGLAIGGAPLTIAVTSAIAYFVLGVGYAILFGKVGAVVVLKKSIVAALLCITIFIMLTNIISATTTMYNVSELSAPVSIQTRYGSAGVINVIKTDTDILEYRGIYAVYANNYDQEIQIFLTTLDFSAAIIMLTIAYSKLINRLVYKEKKKKFNSVKFLMILALIYFAMYAILTMVFFMGSLEKAISNISKRVNTAIIFDVTMRVQFYIAAALLAIALIFELAFRPRNKVEISAQQLNAKK